MTRKTLEGASPGALERIDRAARMAREASQAKAEYDQTSRSVDERTLRLKAMRMERDRLAAQAAADAKPAPKRKARAKAK